MPLNVYYYTPAEAGLAEYPPGLMRLADTQTVTDPRAADVFVLPTILRNVGPERFAQLPYLRGNERRHVAWNQADDYTVYYPCGPLYLRADAGRQMVRDCATVKAWPWPVEDYYSPFSGFDYDVVFQGWASTPLTKTVCDSVAAVPSLNAHLQTHSFFYGYHYHDPQFQHYKTSFRRTLQRARLSLVPRSIAAGVIRYRFYEALSAGRVPVHFCDNCVLPFADKIDYARCSIHIAEAQAPHAGQLIKDILGRYSDAELLAMGRYGRQMWLRYLAPDAWESMFTEVVTEWMA